jgi:threonine/homoserine/homoserine lactone efflux protein
MCTRLLIAPGQKIGICLLLFATGLIVTTVAGISSRRRIDAMRLVNSNPRMQELSALLGIVTALTVGVISPGPSFVMVARTAVSSSRSAGLAAALGMGAGGVVFAVAALLGLQGLLVAVPSLYLALKVAGGLYLAYLGVRIWGSAKQQLVATAFASSTGRSKLRSLALGFTTQVSNPKTAIVYASVFAAFLPAVQSLGFDLALVALVFAVEASWYTVVALALSSDRPRDAYLRYKSWLDRGAGGVMVALGLKLVSSARHA